MLKVLAALLLALAIPATVPTQAAALPRGSEDALARTYYRLLLENTRFQESTWNEDEGSYGITNWDVVGALGNAVLLNFGSYDERVSGVSKQTLRDHTVRSLAKAVAQNKFVDPATGTWGARVYWDAAMEAYIAAAAKLLWDDLDGQTRRGVDTMLRGEADYLVTSGATPTDPSREGGTTNGLVGGYVNDTKIEEMGNRTMMLAAADAYLPDDAGATPRREWLDRWTLNMDGLPVADEANPTVVAGKPISEWAQAQNVFDTFVTENHGSWNGMYQQSAGAYPGRNVVHYLIAGRPVPRSQVDLPSNAELFDVLHQLGTDAGVPVEHLIGDRLHLYGRSLIPVTYRSMVHGDRMAARAEQMLADRLGPYVAHPPAGRLVKFFTGTTYETEARAEVAMAYLLHYWRDRLAGDVKPLSQAEYFARAAGVTDYGPVPAIVNHQTPRSLASAVTKPGYVKFAFLPGHDDWLFDVSDKAPAFLPSVAAVDAATARTYTRRRDGVDASATVVRRGSGYAGYATLPDGSAVYATSGTGDDEGTLRLYNLAMPGVPGLDGSRRYTTAGGTLDLAPDGYGNGGVETHAFDAVDARYVRMVGVQAQSQWGYSMYEFEARGPGGTDNLALGKEATASTFFGEASVPGKAVDGDLATRWANSAAERPTMRGWWSVDLGSVQSVDEVTIRWQEDAWPINYRVEVSSDGTTWRPVANVPRWREVDGGWLNVDGRAGFVVHGSGNPIGVAPNAVALSHGPASASAGMVVRAIPGLSPAATAQAARAPQPTGGPAQLRSALSGGYLSLFNLGGAAVNAALQVPQSGSERTAYRGLQETTASGIEYQASVPAGAAAVEVPRFKVRSPAGTRVEVVDSRTVRVTAAADSAVRLTSVATGEKRTVDVRRGQPREVRFAAGIVTPTDDLARDRITYPSSPLPPGMSDPDLAVDADPRTAWRAGGTDRRMVVNLGTTAAVTDVGLRWSGGTVPSHAVETSTDGVTWAPFRAGTEARYVSVRVTTWPSRAAGLAELSVR